jgi:hypothetical protein
MTCTIFEPIKRWQVIPHGAAILWEMQEPHTKAGAQPGEQLGCSVHFTALSEGFLGCRVHNGKVLGTPLKWLNH